MDRVGILDIGSNSVRLVIYELFGAAFTPVYNEKVLAGLGRDLRRTGRLSEDGRTLTLSALKRFKRIAEAQNLSHIIIGATAALRDASDALDFIKHVKEETGFDISPVSGAEEARLTAKGVIAALPTAKGIAADLGGASLELIEIDNGVVMAGQTYPIGPFKMLGNDLSEGAEFDIETIRASVIAELKERGFPEHKDQALYLIGGAWRNLAAVHQALCDYPMHTLQAYKLSPKTAVKHTRWAYGPGRHDILNWPKISSRRAETLPYGALLLDILIEMLSPSEIIISTTGLREGLLYDALPETLQARDALFDGCRDLARGNQQSLHFSEPLFRFLETPSSRFPMCFEIENETRLRRAACYLAGIGKGLHPDYRADLVFEDVLYAPLSGLDHKERAYLSLILYSSYTEGSSTPNQKAIEHLLSDAEQNAARCYGSAIRLAVVASGRSHILLDAFTLKVSDTRLQLWVTPDAEDLINARVELRAKRLANRAGLDLEIGTQNTL